MQKVTTEQVKQALIRIAEQSHNNHFGLLVVREVVHAIRNNTHHYLKNQTLQEIYSSESDNSENQNKELEMLFDSQKDEVLIKVKKIKTYYAGQKHLVKMSGVSDRAVTLLIRGELQLSYRLWKKIHGVIDEVIEALETQKIEKEKRKHGYYMSYKQGCRCEDCRMAWRNYIANNELKKIKNNQA